MAITNNKHTAVDPRLQEETPMGDSYVESELEDGSIEFDFNEESVESILQSEGVINLNKEHYDNLAEDLDEDVLDEIGGDILKRFQEDSDSRAQWLETIADGMELLGIEVENTDDPFPGACAAHHPMILEAAVKFQAKSSNELFSSKGPVKTQVVGSSDEEKDAQAARIQNHMNYQVMDQMEEYFDETERMLFYLPIVGSGFKKTYYSGVLDRPVSEFIPVDEFVVNYHTTSLKTASCFTHVIGRHTNDLKKDIVNGFYREAELEEPAARQHQGEAEIVVDEITGVYPSADDKMYELLEQYCYIDIEDDPQRSPDGIALPYVVTVEAITGTVLSIRRNWLEDDDVNHMICPFTHYKFVPGMGFYGLGFIHLLGNLQTTLTATMRSLIDSGTFANLQGGFVDKRLRIKENDGPLAAGEYRQVESGGLPLREAIMPLQFKEPSATLFAMFQHIETRGQKFADSTEQVVADAASYGPVGTTMALLEASGKFFSGVHKRLHKAQKHEFKILASLNHEYLGDKESFDRVGQTFTVSKEDYDGRIDVLPVSDPNVGSQAQKLTLAQAVYTAALQNPEIHDDYQITKYYYRSLGVDDDDIEKFLPSPEEAEPSDPITDIMKVQKGTPIAAFPGQEHDAHIQVKSSFLQDITMGGNPLMAPLMPLVQANVQEHLILKFQQSIAGTIGNQEPSQALIAQAAQKVAETNNKMAELEAKGPDEARNKIADAELQKVSLKGLEMQADNLDKEHKRYMEEMKLTLDKYKTDMQAAATESQELGKAQSGEMKEMMTLIKESMKIDAAAENAEKQVEVQKTIAQMKPSPNEKSVDKPKK